MQTTHRNMLLYLLTSVASLSLGRIVYPRSVSGVHNSGLLHDKSILFQTGNVATRVGQGNFIDFVGVQPDLALSALQD